MLFSPEAQKLWDKVPEDTRAKLLDDGFCTRCLAARHFELAVGEVRDRSLALIGKCATCGGRVVRLIEVT